MNMRALSAIACVVLSFLFQLKASEIPTHGLTVGVQSGDVGQSLEVMYSYGSLIYWP
jgi:hypothetical protein